MSVWSFKYHIIDGEGHTSYVGINYTEGDIELIGVDKIVNLAVANLAGIAGVIDGAVTHVTATWRYDNSYDSAAPDSDVEIKARIGYDVAGTVKRLMQSIPTFKRSLILPNSNRVNQAAAAMSTFLALMTTGVNISGNPCNPVDSEGRDVYEVVTAREAYSKARR